MADDRNDAEKKLIVAAARRQYADGSDDTIEIDDDAQIDRTGDETGVWVGARVYLNERDIENRADDLEDENPFHPESPEGRAYETDSSD